MNKPALPNLTEFQQVDLNGNLLFDGDNLPVFRKEGPFRTLADVERLIATGKPEKTIRAVYENYQLGLPWAFFDDVMILAAENAAIEKRREEVTTLNSQLKPGETPRELPEYRDDWPLRTAPEYRQVAFDDFMAVSINYREKRAVLYAQRMSKEGTVTTALGDCVDALLDAVCVGDMAKANELNAIRMQIKAEVPKPAE